MHTCGRGEYQVRNVQEIARRGADLYDKFVGFVDDLEAIGVRLKQATDSYESAHNKLSKGRGNLVRQAVTLTKLGVKPSKSIPQHLVEAAMQEPLALAASADEESTEE